MTKQTIVQASPEPPLSAGSGLDVAADGVERPAGNTSQPLDQPHERVKAHVDQSTIQQLGANALPVSDYPLKKGPVAANTIDSQEPARREKDR